MKSSLSSAIGLMVVLAVSACSASKHSAGGGDVTNPPGSPGPTTPPPKAYSQVEWIAKGSTFHSLAKGIFHYVVALQANNCYEIRLLNGGPDFSICKDNKLFSGLHNLFNRKIIVEGKPITQQDLGKEDAVGFHYENEPWTYIASPEIKTPGSENLFQQISDFIRKDWQNYSECAQIAELSGTWNAAHIINKVHTDETWEFQGSPVRKNERISFSANMTVQSPQGLDNTGENTRPVSTKRAVLELNHQNCVLSITVEKESKHFYKATNFQSSSNGNSSDQFDLLSCKDEACAVPDPKTDSNSYTWNKPVAKPNDEPAYTEIQWDTFGENALHYSITNTTRAYGAGDCYLLNVTRLYRQDPNQKILICSTEEKLYKGIKALFNGTTKIEETKAGDNSANARDTIKLIHADKGEIVIKAPRIHDQGSENLFENIRDHIETKNFVKCSFLEHLKETWTGVHQDKTVETEESWDILSSKNVADHIVSYQARMTPKTTGDTDGSEPPYTLHNIVINSRTCILSTVAFPQPARFYKVKNHESLPANPGEFSAGSIKFDLHACQDKECTNPVPEAEANSYSWVQNQFYYYSFGRFQFDSRGQTDLHYNIHSNGTDSYVITVTGYKNQKLEKEINIVSGSPYFQVVEDIFHINVNITDSIVSDRTGGNEISGDSVTLGGSRGGNIVFKTSVAPMKNKQYLFKKLRTFIEEQLNATAGCSDISLEGTWTATRRDFTNVLIEKWAISLRDPESDVKEYISSVRSRQDGHNPDPKNNFSSEKKGTIRFDRNNCTLSITAGSNRNETYKVRQSNNGNSFELVSETTSIDSYVWERK